MSLSIFDVRRASPNMSSVQGRRPENIIIKLIQYDSVGGASVVTADVMTFLFVRTGHVVGL